MNMQTKAPGPAPDDFARHVQSVALELLGDFNPALSTKTEWRYGARGSLSVDLERGTFYDHEQECGGGVLDLIVRERGGTRQEAAQWLEGRESIPIPSRPAAPAKARPWHIVDTYQYHDEDGGHLFDVVRLEPKDFRQRAADGSWKVKGIRKVLYRLPRIAAAPDGATIYIVEGEKDAHRLEASGLLATTNPGGAGKWNDTYAANLEGKQAVILPDNDQAGRDHAETVRASLARHGITCGVLNLSGLADKGDVADWLDKGNTAADLEGLAQEALRAPPAADELQGIRPTPFQLRAPAEIPPRQWLYGKHLVRHFISTTVSPGGLGKSSMIGVETLAMATGRDLLGDKPPHPLRVWLWNGEDPREEVERRITAACMHYGITADEMGDRLMMDSGRDVPIKLAAMNGSGVMVARPVADDLIKAIREAQIDVLVIDPFVTSHEVSENDNTAINAVVSEWRRIADMAGCAIELVHHVSKAGAVNKDLDIYASRGAMALIDGVRSGRALVRMSEDERTKFGVEDDEATYFCISGAGKANMAPPAKRVWRKMVGVALGNGGGCWPEGDNVGVCTTWTPPDPMEGISTRDLQRVQEAIVGCHDAPRQNEQASDWAGYVVAETLGMDVAPGATKGERTGLQNAARAKVRQMLKAWIASGSLAIDSTEDKRTGRDVKLITVGDPVTEADIRGQDFD